jgi:hypothetical protein
VQDERYILRNSEKISLDNIHKYICIIYSGCNIPYLIPKAAYREVKIAFVSRKQILQANKF